MRAKTKTRRKARPASPTIDGYLAALSDDKRVALERLRETLRAVMPRAEECISYQMPAFRLDGKVIVWFGAGANHCAFYPGAVVQDFADELQGYETSKGTIRFRPDESLPASLVRKLVKARQAQIAAPKRRVTGGAAPRR
jgi:uncharacterized protein YdhG (YjbR/CyaY superfamily)